LKDFYNYFSKKYVLIEVFDADKLLPFGFTKIALKHFLRQGKQSCKSLLREIDIYDVK